MPASTAPVSSVNAVSIDRVRAFAVRLPLPRVIMAATTPLASRDYLCVEITASDGVVGIGFSYIGTSGAQATLAALDEMVIPALTIFRGDADDAPSVFAAMSAATLIQGRSGIVLNAVSAVDIALWDARAKRRSQTLARHLGALQTRVPAYASGGYYLSEDGLDELDRELDQWRRSGFDRIKLKMKGARADSEIERLRRARAAIGDDGLLLLDFFHAFSERQEAMRFLTRAEPFRPYWIEDPFSPDDLASFAWLARRSGQRLATGEFQSSPAVFDTIGRIGAASVVQAEAPRCGGVTGWFKLADLAQRHGMVMSPCWFHQLHVHLVPAVPNGLFVEYFHGTDVLNFDLLLDQPATVEAGEIVISDRPGLGFGFDHDRITAQCVGSSDTTLRAAS